MQNIAILGSTGSIGIQALDVAARHADRFRITALIAGRNAELLFEQVRAFRPLVAGLAVEPAQIPEDLKDITWVFGPDCARQAARMAEADAVLVAIVGIAGLPAVLDALAAGKRVLLANKEALVAGGALVKRAAKPGQLVPVDSEHSAIFQCLQGAAGNEPTRLLLTASGGPFRTWHKEKIAQATREEALRHPNWAMGSKITIDSATMINKALEVIEAHWLFDMPADRIEVLVHPQSIVHSMVEFVDGGILAQLGTPDMRLPILYAMGYPDRLPTGGARLDLAKLRELTFEAPDFERFPGLALAWQALRAGGDAPAMLNAANEEAVGALLAGRIRFAQIPELVDGALQALAVKSNPALADIYAADKAARAWVAEKIAKGEN